MASRITTSKRVGSRAERRFAVTGTDPTAETTDEAAGEATDESTVESTVESAVDVTMVVDGPIVVPVPQEAHSSTVTSVCGRFTSLTPPDELAAIFDTVEPTPTLFDDFRPNFNVAPTTRIVAIAVDSEGHRRLGRFQWGLVPHWAKDSSGSARLINARSETVFEKPSFRPSIGSRRCIIPMDGFFEWRTVYAAARQAKAPKEPVYVTRSDGSPLAVAGLWTSWRAKGSIEHPGDDDQASEAPWLHTCCILTTAANDTMAPIHDRMPVILERDDWSTWLDTANSDRADIESLMVPARPGIVSVVDVATTVNSIRNNGPDLIVPIRR